jgi:anti-sigma B factor antagonist
VELGAEKIALRNRDPDPRLSCFLKSQLHDGSPRPGEQSDGGYPLSVETQGHRFRARVEGRGRVVVLELLGELDIAAREEADRALEAAIASASGAVVVNLQGLTFMDSTGVRCIFQAKTLADAAGIRLAVLTGSGPAHRTLALIRMDDVLEIVDGLDQLDAQVGGAG